MDTLADKILGTFILFGFFGWLVLEILCLRQRVRAWFDRRREPRAHTDETLAEMYTAHTYAGTRSERQRRQRGG